MTDSKEKKDVEAERVCANKRRQQVSLQEKRVNDRK